MKSDRRIWKKFRKGSKKAFSIIYHQHANALYQFGLKFSNNPELVKDCIQELFLRLIKSRKSLGTVRKIRPYLMVSIKRCIIKELQKKKNIIDFNSSKHLPFHIEYSLEESIMNNEIRDERIRELVAALKKLTPRQKEIVYLRFSCNLEYEEICDIMELTYDAARKLLYRSIKALRKAYIITNDQLN